MEIAKVPELFCTILHNKAGLSFSGAWQGGASTMCTLVWCYTNSHPSLLFNELTKVFNGFVPWLTSKKWSATRQTRRHLFPGIWEICWWSSSIFIKEDLTRSLWGRSRVRKSPFFNAVASLHTDTAVLDSIRNLCDVSIYNHCDSLKSVCYSNYFLSLWNKFPFFGPICEQTVGIKSSGSNMAESSPNSTSECLTACSINSQNVKNIFISHSWFQMESRQSK